MRLPADWVAINSQLSGANDLWPNAKKDPYSIVAQEFFGYSPSSTAASATVAGLWENLERDRFFVAPHIFQFVGGADGSGTEALSSLIIHLELLG
mmetsp:Transcript_50833/g.99412  ORF Transcript_50833/g.99412 Transcript_50833/m.99412 type:complete len:95 (-) Transcript_50833:458-742(-)